MAAVGVALWLILLVAVEVLTRGGPVLVATLDERLRFPAFNLSGALVIVTWVILAVTLLVFVLYSSARARLPLHANRLIFWAIAMGMVFAGQFLFLLERSRSFSERRRPATGRGGWTHLWGCQLSAV